MGDAVNLVQAGSIKGNVVFAGGSGTPWPAFAWLTASVVLSAAVGVLAWLALGRVSSAEPAGPTTWALTCVGLGCLGGTAWGLRRCTAAWRAYRSLGMRHRLLVAADHLAHATAAAWEREEEALRLYDPKALPVRWRTATGHHDQWATIRGSDAEVPPLDLDGHFADILTVFCKVPSGRLVVLGGPGSGKSVLAVRFLLDHLTDRRERHPTGPVAVLLSLSSWDPSGPNFSEWAASRIARDYPELTDMGGTGSSAAAELLENGRLLLVLDGFDEVAPQARPQVLEALNAMRGRSRGKVLLTSRRAEYEAAVEEAGALRAAAVIELERLGTEDLRHFLPLTVGAHGRRGSGGSDHQDSHDGHDGLDGLDGPADHDASGASKWQPVLDALPGSGPRPGDDGEAPSAHAAMLRDVLSTPLMVALARSAYSDTSASPDELLKSGRFPHREDVEDHLLDQFVTAVYRTPPSTYATPTGRWSADEARGWLSSLARRLQRLGLREIVWWRLSPGVPEACRLALETAALALTLGVMTWLVFGQPQRPAQPPPPSALVVQAVACLIALLTRRPGGTETGIEPRRLVIRGRLRAFVTQASIAAAVILPIGLSTQVNAVILAVLPLLFGTRTFVDPAVDISRAGSPQELLRADRRTVAVLAPVYALRSEGPGAVRSWLLAFAALGPLLVTAAWHRTGGRDVVGPFIWTACGAGSFIALALLGVAGSAWWGFTATRVALALTGRLPWGFAAFLEDAHRRGVLRQAGGVYEFRHARLQDRLAGGTAPKPAPPRRALLPPPGANLTAMPLVMVALLTVSFTPGAPGPHDFGGVYCPILADLPSGYHASLDDGTAAPTDDGAADGSAGPDGAEDWQRLSCQWTGQTDTDSAPPLAGSSLTPMPDTSYVGTYSLALLITVVPPKTSRSAVDVASWAFDELGDNYGTQRVPGLGDEALINGTQGGMSELLVRTGNIVIQTIVTEMRSSCYSTVGNIAVTQTAQTLRELGVKKGISPPGYGADPWCDTSGGTTQDEETTETPGPSPSPTPEETEEETEPPAPTELRIESDGVEKSHRCHGGQVEIWADDVELTLVGSCDSVYIHGDSNGLWIQKTEFLGIDGSANSVYCHEAPDDTWDYLALQGKYSYNMALGCSR
ncbi:NACHT domain-containing protein [Streptomyces sp. NBC_00443]|uniref:NACHT domain-containing protein n=1 Tax=Streptomyces sp. NBC_00443 TaxID=2975743 RepID=UPI002E211768